MLEVDEFCKNIRDNLFQDVDNLLRLTEIIGFNDVEKICGEPEEIVNILKKSLEVEIHLFVSRMEGGLFVHFNDQWWWKFKLLTIYSYKLLYEFAKLPTTRKMKN